MGTYAAYLCIVFVSISCHMRQNVRLKMESNSKIALDHFATSFSDDTSSNYSCAYCY